MSSLRLTLTDEDGIVLDYWLIDTTGENPDAWDLSKTAARADLLEEIIETAERHG